jgi:hypothetical protein
MGKNPEGDHRCPLGCDRGSPRKLGTPQRRAPADGHETRPDLTERHSGSQQRPEKDRKRTHRPSRATIKAGVVQETGRLCADSAVLVRSPLPTDSRTHDRAPAKSQSSGCPACTSVPLLALSRPRCGVLGLLDMGVVDRRLVDVAQHPARDRGTRSASSCYASSRDKSLAREIGRATNRLCCPPRVDLGRNRRKRLTIARRLSGPRTGRVVT